MKCPKCLKELPSNAKQCPYCGNKFIIAQKPNAAHAQSKSQKKFQKVNSAKFQQLKNTLKNMPEKHFALLKSALADIPQFNLTERFTNIEKLGRGGMGMVFKAKEKGLDRTVAIKRLLLDEEYAFFGIMRFLREAKTLARLNHPNIVSIYQTSYDEGGIYIVMEYVEGISLSDLLKRRRLLTPIEAYFIISEVAKALDYAHKEGVVHRDIKPGNIMLAGAGVQKLLSAKNFTEKEREEILAQVAVKVLDFGLAKVHNLPEDAISAQERRLAKSQKRDASLELSVTGSVLGTMMYAAPEQRIDAKRVDGRADIYSLGLTLYKMLTGLKPTQFNIAEVPAPFVEVIEKARKADLRARISTIAEFQKILDKSFREEKMRQAAISGTSVECQKFLAEFPQSRYAAEINSLKNKKIEEEAEFHKAVAGSSKACTAYLEKHPDTPFAEQVREILAHKLKTEKLVFGLLKLFVICFVSGVLFGLLFMPIAILGLILGAFFGIAVAVLIAWFRYERKEKLISQSLFKKILKPN